MSEARRNRREWKAYLNKHYSFMKGKTIEQEYTKILCGISDLTESQQLRLRELIRFKRVMDHDFHNKMLCLEFEVRSRLYENQSTENNSN